MSGGLNFVLSLEDRFSPTTKQSSHALRELQNELGASKGKLALFQQQLSHAKELGDVEGYRKYSKLVDDARRETFQLGDSLVEAQGQGAGLMGTLGEMGGAFGPVIAAAAALEVGVAAAFAGIAVEGVKAAIEVNEVNERLTATFEALGDKPGAGKKTLSFLNELSAKLPQSREQLGKWATQYQALGITDLGPLRQQIKATASAQAIGGDVAASAYEHMTEKVRLAVEAHQGLKLGTRTLTQLYKAGANVADVASRMHLSTQELVAELKGGTADAQSFGDALSESLIAKGKGPLAAMSNELGTLKEKGSETFGHLFDGIDTSPIADALKGLIDLGDQANPSGQALKAGIGSGIQGIVNWLGTMGHEGKIVFLEMEVFALKHKHAIHDVGAAFGFVGDVILHAVHGLEELIDLTGKLPIEKILSAASFGLIGSGHLGDKGGQAPALGEGGLVGPPAPAHAEGGLVGRPAAGEYFASVAPGEMILPQRSVRELSAPGFGGRAAAMAAAGSGGGDRSVHVGQIVVQAAGGVTDAHQLSVSGLVLALERLQLGSGR